MHIATVNAPESGSQANMRCVHCAAEELEEHHLPRLKEVIAETNAAYRQYVTREEQRRAAEAEREQAERDELRRIKDRLKFD